MDGVSHYPGTAQHQALLRAFVEHYREDERILALALFGSLGRGNWDADSDLDLDVVLRDGVQVAVLDEVQRLCAAFEEVGERALLIVPDGTESADVALASLCELSIRYHPLATTKPVILESIRLLAGTVSLEAIQAAGRANVQPEPGVEADPLDRFVRLALAADREMRRRRFWVAVTMLEQMRALVVAMFAQARGGGRAYWVFEAEAPEGLRAALAATLAQASAESLHEAFNRLLEIVEERHGELGRPGGLSEGQRTLLAGLRRRQQV